MRTSSARLALLSAVLLLSIPGFARSEPGRSGELGPGEQSVRAPGRAERAVRAGLLRALGASHLAELDSLAALAAASPAGAGAVHREIEAVKRRQAREEAELQRDLAVRSGNLSLVRRLDARLAKLAALEGGAR